MFISLGDARRLLMEVGLRPIQGDRFQPTGFADLGAAVYKSGSGTRMLLVESAQSVANRLESTTIGPDNELVEELMGLSYVRSQMEGDSDAVTNSLIEAHRVNSPFVITNKEFQTKFVAEAGYKKGKPIDWRKIARTMFKFDVNSLLHGAFMANVEDGRVRVARSISGFIEASGVQEVVSGGVKNNPIDPTGKLRAVDYDKDVYSNVPYQRIEYTAERITAYFNLDLGLLRSYDLGNDAFDLLVGLALLKVRRLLDRGMRLRTACDFALLGELTVTEPAGFEVPNEAALLTLVQNKIKAVENMFAEPPVTQLQIKVKMKSAKDEPEGGG